MNQTSGSNMTDEQIVKNLLLNFNRKECKITYEKQDYVFVEPSLDEVILLQETSNMFEAYKILKKRQIEGTDIDSLGVTSQSYLIIKYLEWIKKILDKI